MHRLFSLFSSFLPFFLSILSRLCGCGPAALSWTGFKYSSRIHGRYANVTREKRGEGRKARIKKENFRFRYISRLSFEREIKRIACSGRYCVVDQFNSLRWMGNEGPRIKSRVEISVEFKNWMVLQHATRPPYRLDCISLITRRGRCTN